jgi:hypothetical protein
MAEMIHVFPRDDLREHVTKGECCWCKPDVDEELIIHHAADGREDFETGRRKLG